MNALLFYMGGLTLGFLGIIGALAMADAKWAREVDNEMKQWRK